MQSNPGSNTAGHGRVRVQSPYPALQALLPRLAHLNPSRKNDPIFRQRDEAEFFIRSLSAEAPTHVLTPVWALDHNDLQSSTILSWSVTEHVS